MTTLLKIDSQLNDVLLASCILALPNSLAISEVFISFNSTFTSNSHSFRYSIVIPCFLILIVIL